MNEKNRLLEIFGYMSENMGASSEMFLVDVKDEGLTLNFIETIREQSVHDQAFFLQSLVKFRPECEARLIELASEHDENVEVLANAGLLHTNQNPAALAFFKDKIIQRLMNDKLNDGEWPIHFLMDYLMSPEVCGNKKLAEDILNEAMQIKDVNREQIVWIKKYL